MTTPEPPRPACVTESEWTAIRESAQALADAAPPLTPGQREQLRAIFAPVVAARAGAA